MEIALLTLNAVLVAVVLLVVLLRKPNGGATDAVEKKLTDGFAEMRKETREMHAENRQETNTLVTNLQKAVEVKMNENIQLQKKQHSDFDTQLKTDFRTNRQELARGLGSFEDKFAVNVEEFGNRLEQSFTKMKDSITEIKTDVEKRLGEIKEDNTRQLNAMRQTVDEKLQSTLEKRLSESFNQVSERLEQVHKGLGEMQNLATGVGDLKKVLSNVKTRGIWGEYQLENILEEILPPQHYQKSAQIGQGGRAQVDFAVKLPGKQNDEPVFLPIDSKFPMTHYESLRQAEDAGNTDGIQTARRELLDAVKKFAKDISQKYISPPQTTDFAVMFLPVEGLYAEILRESVLLDDLRTTHKITITGPTTISAFLNSLSMGFRTLAVQQRSSEVWQALADVKTEFGRFSEVLGTAHTQINRAANTLDNLRTTRVNQMQRKLDRIGDNQQPELPIAEQALMPAAE